MNTTLVSVNCCSSTFCSIKPNSTQNFLAGKFLPAKYTGADHCRMVQKSGVPGHWTNGAIYTNCSCYVDWCGVSV